MNRCHAFFTLPLLAALLASSACLEWEPKDMLDASVDGAGDGGKTGDASCDPNPCMSGGTCNTAAGLPQCTCLAGTEGTYCEINPDNCSPNPCQNGGTCKDGVGKFTCSCPGFWAGATCQLRICSDVSIRTQADVDSYKNCVEISNLSIVLSGTDSIVLPNLARVTGSLSVSPMDSGAKIPWVTLSKLETIRGSLSVSHANGPLSGSVVQYHFPSLREIGGALRLQNIPGTKSLDFSSLEKVGFSIDISNGKDLCSADFGMVSATGGDLTLSGLPKLDAAAVRPLQVATVDSGFRHTSSSVGCCYTSGATADCAGQSYVPGSAACACTP